MGRIRILPDHLANQIAAGEVVERPASALKELIENSFDAGADSIRISLEAGGKRRIRVEDNGCGMDRDDCLMAVERHATSKLTRAEDLFSIHTLGFRGEALPSIASVSRFAIESRTRDAEAGVRVVVNGSKLSKVTEVSRNPGTSITVDNLFFNIPARKKFLRKTETELSQMVNLVTQYSIAHIDKHFFLEHNGRVLMDTPPVKKLEERIYQQFGKKMLDELVPVSMERDWLKIRGLTSTPNYFKTSRLFQYLFVNGRLVKDKVLSHAITAAYQGFTEGRAYPVVFLFVDMPSTEVDVNVHPAKTEVKFIHADFVHDNVSQALRAPLLERKLTIPYRFRDAYHTHPSQQPDRQIPMRKPDPWSQPIPSQTHLPGANPVDQTPLFNGKQQSENPDGENRDTAYQRFLDRNRDLIAQAGADVPGGSEAPQSAQPAMPPQNLPWQNTGGQQPPMDQNVQQPHQPAAQASGATLFGQDPTLTLPQVIGQFRESYILAEQEGDLLLIDQHVAHERILYDQISDALARDAIERQALLVPVTLELSPHQAVILEELMPVVKKFGFDLEPFDGNTFIIREVPVFAQNEDIETFVAELVEKAEGKRGETALEAMIDLFAATKACKAAVKINMRLTGEKMNHLIETLWASSSPLFCPHGRPIILRFRNDEIEKNFLRK